MITQLQLINIIIRIRPGFGDKVIRLIVVDQIIKLNLKIWALTMTVVFPIWPMSHIAVKNGWYIKVSCGQIQGSYG